MTEIELPDGTILEAPDDITPEALKRAVQTHMSTQQASQQPIAQPVAQPSESTTPSSLLKSGARGLALGVAGLPNYLADLAVRGANSLGLSQVPQEGLPSARFRKFLEQAGLPQQPGLPNQLVEMTGETLGGMYGTPGIGTSAKAWPTPQMPIKPSAQDYARWVALQSGYKMTPTSVPGTPFGNALESVASPSKLRQEVTDVNQQVRNAAMRRAAGPFETQAGNVVPGMREGDVLTGKGLTDQISGIWNATQKPLVDNPAPVRFTSSLYRDLRGVIRETAGNPSAPEYRKDIADRLRNLMKHYDSETILDTIKSLRSDADDIARSTAKKDTKLQNALSGAANALEKQLEVRLQPSQYKDFTAGRQRMAQLATIRDATLDPTGNADAAEFANRIAKGLPTTGAPYTAGLFSSNFPELSGLSRNAETELFDRISPGLGVSTIGAAFQALGKPIRSYLRSENYQTLLRNPGLLDAEKRMTLAAPAETYNLFQPD